MDKLIIFLSLVAYVAGSHEIEVKFYVDKFAEDRYASFGLNQNQVVEELDYMITEINKIYQRDLGIEIYRKGKVEFLTVNLNPVTDDDVLMMMFNGYVNVIQKPSDDVAVLLTGRDMHRAGNNGVLGIANTASFCEDDSVAIVEVHGKPIDIITLAHEIGHVIGSVHDSGKEDAQGFMMNMYGDTVNTATAFSPSSIANITQKLASVSCHEKKSPDSIRPNQILPSFLNTPNKVCARVFGTWMGDVFTNRGGNPVCKTIKCPGSKTSPFNRPVKSYNGLICGRSKTCHEGECVLDSNTFTGLIKDDCPYGNMRNVYHWATGTYKGCEAFSCDSPLLKKGACCEKCG